MEQRPLRLGDIVDDYCPRERRLTNHAIVAVVDQTIRQTRCTTCDTEHVYKDGRLPRRKKAGDGDDLTDLSGGQLVSQRKPPATEPPPAEMPVAAAPASAPDIASAPSESEEVAPAEEPGSLWLAHRQLIRATLPRVDGEPPPARPIPEFTMHQRQGRGPGSGFRSGHSWHGGNGQSRGGNGFRPERNGNVADPPRGNGGIGGGRPGRHRGRGRRPR